MTAIRELTGEDLRFDPGLDPGEGVRTTSDVPALTGTVGQPRAESAVAFGIGMVEDGYHVFALGLPGTGKESLIRATLERAAGARPTPPDLCYVHNFDDPNRPRLLKLPHGTGVSFRNTMDELVEELRTVVASALESEEYRTRQQVINNEFKERPDRELRPIAEAAKAEGLALLKTPVGLAFAPTKNGEVIASEDFEQLPDPEQERLEQRMDSYQEQVQKTLAKIPKWNRERRDRLRELTLEVTGTAVTTLFDEIRLRYQSHPEVLDYLTAVQQNVVEHPQDFLAPEPSLSAALLEGTPQTGPAASLHRFKVNVLVDHADTAGAPIVEEDHPTYDNLVGRLEHRAQFGTLVTDFTLLGAGALHRANGGFLLLEAHRLLRTPYVWDALKRALQSRRVRVESLGQVLGLVSTMSLEPEPVPLQVQVILTGDPVLYYLLCHLDPDFEELFKVAADFDDRMDRTTEAQHRYVQLIAKLVVDKRLRPVDASGIERVLEHSARLAGDRQKLTLRIATIVDLLREANHVAAEAGAGTITGSYVEQAIRAQINRADRLRDRIHENIRRGQIMIDTDGAVTGQVNGVSVISLGNFAFGHPSRITARVRVGHGKVIDIEREAELGGRIHSKGVLILASYLGAHYVPDHPLSLSASLVFEQTYGGVEGDSASLAELLALVSAIADVPLRQDLAVTGSVNQHGRVQAVGGVTEKVEGFFDICRMRGLTGTQGAILPSANVDHLVLRQELLDAIADGDFHLYAIDTVDHGIELLTGMPAGSRGPRGQYPDGSVNGLVEERLARLAEVRRTFNLPSQPSEVGV